MKEIEKALNIKKVKVKKFEEIKEGAKLKTVITLIGTPKKMKCPVCNKYTSSVHSKLKPINNKYLKIFEKDCELKIMKRRFICHKCNKIFTEDLGIGDKKAKISNAIKINIRKDLLDYNLSIKYIAESNGVSPTVVRKELVEATKEYKKRLRTLPEVISFDEFKADTKKGKYAFIINDPIKKKTLDILESRKKNYIEQYLTSVENRNNVKYVICDMYEPYLLVTKKMFPKAKFVVDKFHYVRYILQALDKVRIRLQDSYGYNSKEYKLLKNKKNVRLLRKYGIEINWWILTKRCKNGHMVDILPGDVLRELLGISEELKQSVLYKRNFFRYNKSCNI